MLNKTRFITTIIYISTILFPLAIFSACSGGYDNSSPEGRRAELSTIELTPFATHTITQESIPTTPSETLTSAIIDLRFDGERAYQHIQNQVEFGPRTPGSDAHDQTINYITQQLTDVGWVVEIQELAYSGKPIRNIRAYRDVQQSHDEVEWIILGTHYDTRLISDRDPEEQLRTEPVPGANDGASGVAVLLELARVLP